MNFDLTEDQKMILDTVRTFVKKELPMERMRKMRDDERGYSPEVWKHMGELGWLGIAYPEEVGGFGGSFVDASLIVEQFGTALVSEPYLASAVLAGKALLLAGNAEQHEQWLTPMLEGTTTLALAYAERDSRFDSASVATRAEKSGDGYRIKGEKVWVLNGHAADQLVVSARTAGDERSADGVSLFLVDKDDAGLERQPLKTMDGQRAANISLDVQLGADRLLGEAGGAAPLLERVMDYGAAALCAEGSGMLATVLAMTLEYLKTREQFGVKIGTFQALQHRAVDMFVETELAKSTAIMAAIKVDYDDAEQRKRATSAAKVQLAVSGKFVTQQAIQLHGGIGVTDEHEVGLFFKRMHVANTLCGDEEHHVARFAALDSFAQAAEGE
jgi:alkylation response protein AidB-like acyl-CoA dehydrogenase